MLNSKHRSVRSLIGPPHPQPWTMRRLLRGGPGHANIVGEPGQATADAQRVFAALKVLTIPNPWNLRDFISGLEEQRCRPIRLEPYPTEAQVQHPCGMWIPCKEADVIFVEHSTSQYHCQQIILHEIGHIVLDHQALSAGATGPEAMSQLMPDVDSASMAKALGRTTFDNELENQAELFASLLLSQQCTTMKGFELFPI